MSTCCTQSFFTFTFFTARQTRARSEHGRESECCWPEECTDPRRSATQTPLRRKPGSTSIFNNGSERQVAVRSHHVEVRRRRFKKKRNIRNTKATVLKHGPCDPSCLCFGWAIPASRHAHFQRLPLGLPASLSPSFSSFLDDADGRDLLHMTSVRPRRMSMHHHWHIRPTM